MATRPAGWSAHRAVHTDAPDPTAARSCFTCCPKAALNSAAKDIAMTQLLSNFLGGRWQAGNGSSTPLFDPTLGTELVRVDATGLDLAAGFAFAREQGRAALQRLSYRERAAMLAAAVKVLQAKRDAYYEIATANSGTVKNDSAVDIDGAIFTLGHYAKLGDTLGDTQLLRDGEPARLAKDPLFQSQHVLTPTRGV